jgi:hypothetical protein
MRSRLVRIGVVAITALSTATAVSGTAAPSHPAGTATTPVNGTFTVTGRAGGEAFVRLTKDAELDVATQDKIPLRVSGGGFAGVVVTNKAGDRYISVTSGVSGAECAFAHSCDSFDWSTVDGSHSADTSGAGAFRLPAGTYTVGLVGAPGSTVTATLAFGSRHATRVVHVTRFGDLRAKALASTEPSAADEAPMTDGATTLPGPRGVTFIGAVIRWDLNVAHQLNYSTCVGDGEGVLLPATSVAGVTACTGESGSTAGEVAITQCGPVPVVCLPATTEPFVVTVASTTVRPTARPQYAVGTQTKAAQSRVAVTVFALTL